MISCPRCGKDETKEVWKTIPGIDKIFTVSNLGRVRKGDKLRNQNPDKDGYPRVSVGNVMRVHRLVALAFIPNPENKRTVNHIDGVKDCNCTCNLEWSSMREQNLHSYRTGLRSTNRKFLTEEYVGQVIDHLQNRKRFKTIKQIAEHLGVSESEISQINRGARGKNFYPDIERPIRKKPKSTQLLILFEE